MQRCGAGMGEPMKKRQLKQSVVREEQQSFSLTAESNLSFPFESLEHSHQDGYVWMYLPQVLEKTGCVFPSYAQYLVGPRPRMARLG